MKKAIILGDVNGMLIAATIERNHVATCEGFLNDVDAKGTYYGIKKKLPVLGRTDEITELLQKDRDLYVISAYGGFTNPKATLARLKSLDIPEDRWLTVVDKTAVILPDYCDIGTNCFVGALAQISANVVVGKHCSLYGNCIVGHDSKVGEFCHLASNSVIGSHVKIGTGVHIGLNATVREYITIGNNSIIGAGAVVMRDVPDNAIVAGNPARVLKYREEDGTLGNGIFTPK